MKTLPDYLRHGLDIVSIGINPSLPSVREGYYFANPRNRFWRALNASGLLPVLVVPGKATMDLLVSEYGIGFTDVVKRPTANASSLHAADFRDWAPILRDKLEQYAPRIAWFQGKQGCTQYLKYAEGMKAELEWGEQPFRVCGARVFVSPSPSPANAAYSLEELTDWMRRLKALRQGPD